MELTNSLGFSPTARRYGTLLRYALKLIPPWMRMPILQGPLRGQKWVVGSARYACWLGTYEAQESALLELTLQPSNIVFDLGAQAGYHSLLAASLVGPNGKVYAFEPDRRNVDYLRKHLALNEVTNVVVLHSAVSNFDGISMFDEGENRFSGHLSPHGRRAVRTISLDKQISKGRLPIPDFMKIDVEGAELEVLAGAKNVLREHHPTLLLETHEWMPQFASIRADCSRFLTSLNYRLELMSDCHIFACHASAAFAKTA